MYMFRQLDRTKNWASSGTSQLHFLESRGWFTACVLCKEEVRPDIFYRGRRPTCPSSIYLNWLFSAHVFGNEAYVHIKAAKKMDVSAMSAFTSVSVDQKTWTNGFGWARRVLCIQILSSKPRSWTSCNLVQNCKSQIGSSFLFFDFACSAAESPRGFKGS